MAPELFQNLVETAQVRSLTENETALLKKLFLNHPHLEEVWQEEMALNALVHRATISSPSDNLADAVMQKIHETNKCSSSKKSLLNESSILNLFFRYCRHPYSLSFASLLIVFVTFQWINEHDSRPLDAQVIRDVSVIPELTEKLSADMLATDTLQDFPAIVYSIEVEKMIDKELLLAMKEIR